MYNATNSLSYKTLLFFIIFFIFTGTHSYADCSEDSHVEQGTDFFLEGVCSELPLWSEHHCLNGKQPIQGTTTCATQSNKPLQYLITTPSCPLGKAPRQGTDICSEERLTVTLDAESNGTVVENASMGEIVGQITILDSGNGSDIESITLRGEGSVNFEVALDGTITVAANASLDFETTAQYSLSAIATNSAGSSRSVKVNISVTNYGNNVPFQIAKLQASDASFGDWFGDAVSMSGDYIVVGARGDLENGALGSAYLFKKRADDSIVEIAKLQSDNPGLSDNFGNAVAIDGDYIVVGAIGDDELGSNTGAAYLFKKSSDDSTVELLTKIQASDYALGNNFGNAVAIDGDYIIIGAYGDDENGTDAGSAYLFKKSEGDVIISQIAKIVANNIEADDRFATAVSISGNYIVVGAPQKDINGTDTGSAYLFKKSSDDTNITQIAQLYASGLSTEEYFGHTLCIDGDYIIIGAYGDDTNATNAGSAYLFKKSSNDSTISKIAQLYASDASTSDNFGNSVSIDGEYILIGAHDEDSPAVDAGASYLFKKSSDDTNITQIAKLKASDAQSDDHFGNAVAISGESMVVGASGKELDAGIAGSVYIYDLEPYDRIYLYNQMSSIVVYEGIKDIYNIDATSPSGVVSSTLDGIDSTEFDLNSNLLSFNYITSFENPTDSDLDNIYSVTLQLSNLAGKELVVDMNITVQNQNYLQIDKIQSQDIEAYDRFGTSVSVSGDYIVVGAYREDTVANNAGSAYLFKKEIDGNITEIVKLQADDAQENDFFGYSVAISGDYIAVGAWGEDTTGSDAGSVYLYKKDANDLSVSQIAKIQSDNAHNDDNFGYSVAIDGRYVAVGAWGEDSYGSNSGSAFVFRIEDNNSVTQIGQVGASDLEDYDFFGESIAISGNYIIVGANHEDSITEASGAAYLFKKDSNDLTITQIAKLKADDADSYDNFGKSVSISGDYMVIGANQEDENGADSGATYLFERESDSSVVQLAKITPTDAEAGDNFGYSVSIDGNSIVVGARYEDTVASKAGSAYIFKREIDDSITQVTKLQADDAEAEDRFGFSVSMDSNLTAVGAYYESTNGTKAGSVYLYAIDQD